MRWAIVAVLLLSASGANHARAQPLPATAQVPTDLTSGTEFLAMYDSGDAAWRGTHVVLLLGELNGLKAANGILVMQHRASLYCAPDEAGMSGKEALDMIRQEVTARRGLGSLPWYVLFEWCLALRFPCAPS
jgi:hypothetical protein